MIIAWNWLETLVDLSSYKPADVAAILTQRGLEVEGIEGSQAVAEGIVVGRIDKIFPHPNSDHLHLVDVDLGHTRTRVVCGAPGIEEGWHVPFAPVGTQIGDIVIKKSKIRGEVSEGMLCSERELSLGQDHQTLLRLSSQIPPGTPLPDALAFDCPPHCFAYPGPCLNISLTPDRGDCLSHKGIARELASGIRRKAKNLEQASWEPSLKAKIVSVENTADCPRYLAIQIDDLKVGPSPAWLRRAVEAAGARSINNAVDVTNFVCFELGQPLHAFDRDKLESQNIVVRRARENETLTAINHTQYTLTPEDIVICDESGPQAIAGVMGGAHSEVSETSTRILLEIAAFSAGNVRKTAKRLGLHSESSHRFERGTDAASIMGVARRAVHLLNLTQSSPVTVRAFHDTAESCIDCALAMEQNITSPDVPLVQLAQNPSCCVSARSVTLRLERVNAILGTELQLQDLHNILTRVGFVLDFVDDSTAKALVPTHRNDITREIDIIEELARDLGFDNIKAVLPQVSMQCSHTELKHLRKPNNYVLEPTIWSRDARARQEHMRQSLMHAGLMECMHYTFMDPQDPSRLGFAPDARESNPVLLANPMAAEQSSMRSTLLPSMLKALKTNASRQQEIVAFFELGTVFFADRSHSPMQIREEEHLCILLWGKAHDQWDNKARPYDVYDLKGILEALAQAMQWPLNFRQDTEFACYLHDGVQARIVFDNKTLGFFGELHPSVAGQYKLDGSVFVAELDLSALNHLAAGVELCKPLPRFPRSTRDLSLLVSTEITYAQIAEIIEQNKPSTLEYWELFDVYRGKQVREGMQSISLSFAYRDPMASDPEKGHTLTDDEVSLAHEQLRNALERALGAQLRA